MTSMSPRQGAPLAALAALFVLTACGGGGGGGGSAPAPAPVNPPTPSLQATADSTNAAPDGPPVPLHAVVTSSSAVPSWKLAGPGSLSASSGGEVSYLPPTGEAAVDGGTATVTVAAAGLDSRTLTITLAAAPPAPGRHWTTLREAGVRWQGVASDGHLYVAYGDHGHISTSPDGQTWTARATGEDDTLSTAVHGDQGWLAFGLNHAWLASPDGVTWTSVPLQFDHVRPSSVKVAVAGNGHYVAVGSGTAASSDGALWSVADRWLYWVTFGNGVFVGIDINFRLVHSTDGAHWLDGDGTLASPTDNAAHGVAFANGRFAAITNAGTVTSTDGVAWSPAAATQVRRVYPTQDAFFTICASPLFGDDLCNSGDASFWFDHSPINSIDPFSGLAGDAASWVRVSNYGSLEWNPRTTDQWTTAVPGTIGNLVAVDYVSGRTVAVSSVGWAISSADGQSWDSAYTSPFSGTPGEAFSPLALAHRGDVLVAVGLRTNGTNPVAGEMTLSPDGGQGWIIAAKQPLPVRAVVDDGQRFVAVGDGGQVYASADGQAWSSLATVAGAPSLAAVAYGAGHYVATGPHGTLATSPDGASWTPVTPTAADAPIDFAAVLFDGQRFVRIGTVNRVSSVRIPTDGIVQTSVDGAVWTTQSTPVPVAASLAFHDGEYVLLTGDGALYSSRDLKTWTLRVEATLASLLAWSDGADLRAVAYVNGRFVAVGANEGMLSSSD